MGSMSCCGRSSYSLLSFRKELVAGWAGARMGSVENEASLCSLAVDCFPCFRTQPLLGDVLPGVFDALFSIFMRLFFFNMRLFVQALAICFFSPLSLQVCMQFFFKMCRVVCEFQLAWSQGCLAGVPALVCCVSGV